MRKAEPQTTWDLTECDKEPIHTPGSIQPLGVLLVLKEPELNIVQISANVSQYFGMSAEELLGNSIRNIFEQEDFDNFNQFISHNELESNPTFAFKISRNILGHWVVMNLIVHRKNGFIVLEFEAVRNRKKKESLTLGQSLKYTLSKMRMAESFGQFWDTVITEVKQLTGYDRVMVYEFNQDGHGSVIAEVKESTLESYLDLHYPASDIPLQARELYLKNTLRQIPDAHYQPVPILPLINPESGDALDMTYVSFRSVSPVHIKYLHNMGVVSTLSVTIYDNGNLWGLIACHNYSPLFITLEDRIILSVIGHFVSLENMVRLKQKEYLYEIEMTKIKKQLIDSMINSECIVSGLMDFGPNLGDFISAKGAILYKGSVIYADNKHSITGLTPPAEEIPALIDWLNNTMKEAVYSTNELSKVYPPAHKYKDIASGLMAISISNSTRDYILWFRPEEIQTVNWAGEPLKVPLDGETLTPRTSFERWKEIVKNKSLPWTPYERFAAFEVREAIVHVIAQKSRELKLINKELDSKLTETAKALSRSNLELARYSEIAYEELHSPLRKISAFSDFLNENIPRSEVKESADYVDRIRKSVKKMQFLVDDLYKLAEVARNETDYTPVNFREVILSAKNELMPLIESTKGSIEIGVTTTIECDRPQAYHLLLNLIENGLKFHKKDVAPIVRVSVKALDPNNCEIIVEDNGIGFDEKDMNRIFKTFERLECTSSYQGLGIGLGIVQKIVDKLHGTISAKSKLGEGSTFKVILPLKVSQC